MVDLCLIVSAGLGQQELLGGTAGSWASLLPLPVVLPAAMVLAAASLGGSGAAFWKKLLLLLRKRCFGGLLKDLD